jgi:hypothetical protein
MYQQIVSNLEITIQNRYIYNNTEL